MKVSFISAKSRGPNNKNFYLTETTTLAFTEVLVHVNVTADEILGIGLTGIITLANCVMTGLLDSLNYNKVLAISDGSPAISDLSGNLQGPYQGPAGIYPPNLVIKSISPVTSGGRSHAFASDLGTNLNHTVIDI